MLRGGSAVAGAIAAFVGLAPPAVPAAVTAAVVGLVGWATGYVAVALTRGLVRLPVRRALTEAPLHALAGAQRHARVTVVGRTDEVAVSVVADGRPPEAADLAGPPGSGVTVTVQEGHDRRWIEARWQRR